MSKPLPHGRRLPAPPDAARSATLTERRTHATPTTLDAIPVTLSQRAVVWTLVTVAALIVTAHLAITVIRDIMDVRFVGLDNLYTAFGMWAESSVSNWFAATLTLIAAGLLAVIAIAKRAQRDRFAAAWTGLAVIFLVLAIDDAADVHGQLSYVLHERYQTEGWLLYAWVVPGIAAVALVGLLYARFLWNLPDGVRWRFVVAGGIYCVSALGLELLESRYDSLNGVENLPYKIMVTIEETVEMGALILFVATLLTLLRSLAPEVRIRLQ